MSAADAVRRVRAIALALPETNERLSHGAPTFFIRDKRTFAMFVDNHHNDRKVAVWCAAPPGAQEAMIGHDPVRFFRPAYVGHRGWVGVRLDIGPDWKRVAAAIEDAYDFVRAKAGWVRPS